MCNGGQWPFTNHTRSRAELHHVQPASVALAWLMARPGITAPLASVTNLVQLEDLLRSVALELDAASFELLNKASDWRESSETGAWEA
jgi:aryl-alcohol dehydrogenase-like predicted oxidoreductase